MKLVRYMYNQREQFGFVRNERVYSFSDISSDDKTERLLRTLDTYLVNLPGSREHAEELCADAESFQGVSLKEVQLLPITGEPTALIDFGLTPLHLEQAALGFISHEFSGLKALIAKKLVKKRISAALKSSTYPYYQGNSAAVSGEGDLVKWPSYSEYLDIEPELAFIYGNENEKIAGYLIYNDLSARDVQFPELNELSLTRSKHFDNGIGSFLVTPDEIEDPRSLKVTVAIGDRETWDGDCSNYTISPQEVAAYLETIAVPAAGTVIGMGTVPGTCSIETGTWLEPGELFTITFEKLGSLTQRVPSEVAPLVQGRWKRREFRNS